MRRTKTNLHTARTQHFWRIKISPEISHTSLTVLVHRQLHQALRSPKKPAGVFIFINKICDNTLIYCDNRECVPATKQSNWFLVAITFTIYNSSLLTSDSGTVSQSESDDDLWWIQHSTTSASFGRHDTCTNSQILSSRAPYQVLYPRHLRTAPLASRPATLTTWCKRWSQAHLAPEFDHGPLEVSSSLRYQHSHSLLTNFSFLRYKTSSTQNKMSLNEMNWHEHHLYATEALTKWQSHLRAHYSHIQLMCDSRLIPKYECAALKLCD